MSTLLVLRRKYREYNRCIKYSNIPALTLHLVGSYLRLRLVELLLQILNW